MVQDKNYLQILGDKSQSFRIFDRIAHRYDLANRLLSFGFDVRWRKEVAKCVPKRADLFVLDVATGTGDLLFTLKKDCPWIKNAIGIDLSKKMLEIARQKIAKLGFGNGVEFREGNGVDLPFGNDVFDAATIGFGIRNMPSMAKCLSELNRVLKKGGKAVILEFSLPESEPFRKSYLFYFRHILPKLGGFISGDKNAYGYLNKSVEDFPYGEEFEILMREQGFWNVRSMPLFFGIATIYVGTKEW